MITLILSKKTEKIENLERNEGVFKDEAGTDIGSLYNSVCFLKLFNDFCRFFKRFIFCNLLKKFFSTSQYHFFKPQSSLVSSFPKILRYLKPFPCPIQV